MNEAMLEEHLAQADAHIALGERHITRQLEIIARLDAARLDTGRAFRLLEQFEGLQKEHVLHRDRIIRKLAEIYRLNRQATS